MKELFISFFKKLFVRKVCEKVQTPHEKVADKILEKVRDNAIQKLHEEADAISAKIESKVEETIKKNLNQMDL